jgi:hypothetical protein
MPADCGVLQGIYMRLVSKLEDCESSKEGILQNLVASQIALGGAEAAAAACILLAEAPPAAAVCLVGAGIAIAAAEAAVYYFEGLLEEVEKAIEQTQAALDEVSGLMDHCEELGSGQQAQADALAQQGEEAEGMAVDPPEVDDGPLQEAEQALAELEGAASDSAYG